MNKFLGGFFIGIGFVVFFAAIRVSQKYENSNEIEKEFLNVYEYLQDSQYRVELTTPTLDVVKEKAVFFVNNNGVRMGIKINNRFYFSDFR